MDPFQAPTKEGCVRIQMVGTSPTRAEIDAAIELPEAEFPGGWEPRDLLIGVSDGASRFPKTILGTQYRDVDPVMTHAGDKLLLVEGAEGFLLVFGDGDVPGAKLWIRPVSVGQVCRDHSVANVPPRWRVTFATPAEPSACVVPPADSNSS